MYMIPSFGVLNKSLSHNIAGRPPVVPGVCRHTFTEVTPYRLSLWSMSQDVMANASTPSMTNISGETSGN